jgi:hypothetical protein
MHFVFYWPLRLDGWIQTLKLRTVSQFFTNSETASDLVEVAGFKTLTLRIMSPLSYHYATSFGQPSLKNFKAEMHFVIRCRHFIFIFISHFYIFREKK